LNDEYLDKNNRDTVGAESLFHAKSLCRGTFAVHLRPLKLSYEPDFLTSSYLNIVEWIKIKKLNFFSDFIVQKAREKNTPFFKVFLATAIMAVGGFLDLKFIYSSRVLYHVQILQVLYGVIGENFFKNWI
jgi:hypothetical protein